MIDTLRHLVLIRHGESEGDVRRAAWKRGEAYTTNKKPEDEALTPHGEEQSRLAGKWIAEHIIKPFGITKFDGCYVSTALRSEQSAVALDLGITVWQEEPNLDERNRGLIRGLRAREHKERFPESYKRMTTDILGWQPPDGETMRQVSSRQLQFLENIRGLAAVIAVTHRDSMWASMQPIEGLSDAEMCAVNTDEIGNANILHYISFDPQSGEQQPVLMWKRLIDPAVQTDPPDWQLLPHVAAHYRVS